MTSDHTNPFEYINEAKTTQMVKDLAAHVYAFSRTSAPDIWIGRAWDSNSSEHSSGRALDIIVSTYAGTLPTHDQKRQAALVVDWFKRNADELHLGWIIWDKQIWSVGRQREGWRDLTGRSGIGDWHQDHIHIYLEDTAGNIPSEPLMKGTSMAPTTTKYALSMLNVWNASTGNAWEGEYQKGDAVQVTGVKTSERTQVLYNGALKWVTSKWITDVNPNPPVVTPPVVTPPVKPAVPVTNINNVYGPSLEDIMKVLTPKLDEVNKNINTLRAELLTRDLADSRTINQISVNVADFPEVTKQIGDLSTKLEAVRLKLSNIFK